MTTNGRAAVDTQKQRHIAVDASCMLCTDYPTNRDAEATERQSLEPFSVACS